MPEGKADKEFFDEILGRVDWDYFLPDVIDLKDKITIAMLIELNATQALMCNLLNENMEDNNRAGADCVICPDCKNEVVPDALGYCPKCKSDLARFLKKGA